LKETQAAKKYVVRGRVQGVGFRNFVQVAAKHLGVRGHARNLADGNVEVYAMGTDAQLSDLKALLHQGPRWADVRGVDEQEAPLETRQSFVIL
jgi:acylphosphatase